MDGNKYYIISYIVLRLYGNWIDKGIFQFYHTDVSLMRHSYKYVRLKFLFNKLNFSLNLKLLNIQHPHNVQTFIKKKFCMYRNSGSNTKIGLLGS